MNGHASACVHRLLSDLANHAKSKALWCFGAWLGHSIFACWLRSVPSCCWYRGVCRQDGCSSIAFEHGGLEASSLRFGGCKHSAAARWLRYTCCIGRQALSRLFKDFGRGRPGSLSLKTNLMHICVWQDALEPHMSKSTLDYHWGQHHRSYVNNLKKQIEGTELA